MFLTFRVTIRYNILTCISSLQLILDRVEADRGDSIPDEMTGKKVIKHLTDPLVWAFGMSTFE